MEEIIKQLDARFVGEIIIGAFLFLLRSPLFQKKGT